MGSGFKASKLHGLGLGFRVSDDVRLFRFQRLGVYGEWRLSKTYSSRCLSMISFTKTRKKDGRLKGRHVESLQISSLQALSTRD